MGILLIGLWVTTRSSVEIDPEIARSDRLETCLKEAEKKYWSDFELNSYPNPSSDSSRFWDNVRIQEFSTDQLNKSKELCAKLYK